MKEERQAGQIRVICVNSLFKERFWLRPKAALGPPWFTNSFHLYYYLSESCFPAQISGGAWHKSWKPPELCLAPRRQGRQGEQPCHRVLLAVLASWRENRFWLRPKAALGDSCHSWWKSIWFRSKAGLRKSVPSAASWSCGLPSRGRLGYILRLFAFFAAMRRQ